MTDEIVRATGITVLAGGGQEPVADILFVHGVQGHPERTWTYTTSSRLSLGVLIRSPRKSKLEVQTSGVAVREVRDTPSTSSASSTLSSRQSSKAVPKDVFWPKDLLPHDCADARILTYGYDSHISGFFKAAANQDGIYQHARKLMHALKQERKPAQRRPLILIAHSLGGIIVKEMLLQANDKADPSSRDIYMSVHAIVFFGTPHRGSELASYGQTVERMTRMLGFATNASLLHDLRPNGQMLEKIRIEFLKLLNDQDNQIQVFSFQENRGLTKMSFASNKIVENVSSSLDFHREQVNAIDADHRMMCRFHGPTDEGYRQVSGVVKTYLEEIRKSAADSKHSLRDIQTRAAAQCLESLRYRGMFERQNQMKQADEHTFEWIFDNSNTGFLPWLQNDEGLFWINGKPGSGKSTIMKYLYDNVKMKLTLKSPKIAQWAVAGFFFSNLGPSRRADTFTSFLRSILYQILTQMEELFAAIDDVSRTAQDVKGSYNWTQPLLEEAFRQLQSQTHTKGRIYLYIDALDEYEGELAEIATFLKRLGENSHSENVRFKICTSSRPISTFQVIFKATSQLRMQDWTNGDIQLVIKNKLDVTDTRHASELALEILERSEGVFLWVKLVLEKLTIAIFAGESLEELLSMIGDFPRELEALYQQCMSNVPPSKFTSTRIMLELALCGSGRLAPITLAEFSLAVLWEQDPAQRPSLKCSPSKVFEHCYEMEKRIKTCCGGLLEIVPNQVWESRENCPPQSLYAPLTAEKCSLTMSKVQFVHRTASEFVLSEHNRAFLGLRDTNESVLLGNLLMMALYVNLARDCKGSYFLYTANGNFTGHGDNTAEYSIFNTLLFDHFCAHARDIEYAKCAEGLPNPKTIPSQGGRAMAAKSHKGHETLSGIANSGERRDCGEKMEKFMSLKSDIIDMFNNVLCKSAGDNWVQQWHVIPLFEFSNFDPSPETFLDFAILQGLFSHVRDAIEISKESVTKENLDTYLHWAIMNINFMCDQLVDFDLNLPADEILGYEEFTRYLLMMGADANSRFDAKTLKSKNTADGVDQSCNKFFAGFSTCILESTTEDDMNQRLEEFFAGKGNLVEWFSISILQYALKMLVHACMVSDASASAVFAVVQQLVSAGADVNELMRHRYWINEKRPDDAQARTPLHYLLFENPFPCSADEIRKRTAFEINEIDMARMMFQTRRNELFRTWPIETMATIKSFLDHGADANAVDSEGSTVLEYAFKNGYSEAVELFLERGGLITTKMLDADGKPSADTGGVLRRQMWMASEFYTEEAWEKVKDFVAAVAGLEKGLGKGKELAIRNR